MKKTTIRIATTKIVEKRFLDSFAEWLEENINPEHTGDGYEWSVTCLKAALYLILEGKIVTSQSVIDCVKQSYLDTHPHWWVVVAKATGEVVCVYKDREKCKIDLSSGDYYITAKRWIHATHFSKHNVPGTRQDETYACISVISFRDVIVMKDHIIFTFKGVYDVASLSHEGGFTVSRNNEDMTLEADEVMHPVEMPPGVKRNFFGIQVPA